MKYITSVLCCLYSYLKNIKIVIKNYYYHKFLINNVMLSNYSRFHLMNKNIYSIKAMAKNIFYTITHYTL